MRDATSASHDEAPASGQSSEYAADFVTSETTEDNTPRKSRLDDLDIGRKLREIRTARKLSLRQVQNLTNGRVQHSHLSQIETGKVGCPSVAVLRELANAYGLHLGSLLGALDIIEATPPAQNPEEDLINMYIRRLPEEQVPELTAFVKFWVEQRTAGEEQK